MVWWVGGRLGGLQGRDGYVAWYLTDCGWVDGGVGWWDLGWGWVGCGWGWVGGSWWNSQRGLECLSHTPGRLILLVRVSQMQGSTDPKRDLTTVQRE